MKAEVKCPPELVMRVIKRQSILTEKEFQPEHKLIFAIIGQAVSDLRKRSTRMGAMFFFKDHWFEQYCGLVHVNPESVRDILRTAGYLP